MNCACGKKLGRGNVTGLCRACCAKRNNADPAIMGKRRRAVLTWLASDKAKRLFSARMKARMRAHLEWCPDEHLGDYRKLRNSRKSAAIARAIIESRLTPFERQLQAIRNGAGIREVRPIRRAEPVASLIGISEVYSG